MFVEETKTKNVCLRTEKNLYKQRLYEERKKWLFGRKNANFSAFQKNPKLEKKHKTHILYLKLQKHRLSGNKNFSPRINNLDSFSYIPIEGEKKGPHFMMHSVFSDQEYFSCGNGKHVVGLRIVTSRGPD